MTIFIKYILDTYKPCSSTRYLETGFDGEMEAIADIMEYAIDNQIPGDSDTQAAISHVGHTGTSPGQD
jgi:hypothetical protein